MKKLVINLFTAYALLSISYFQVKAQNTQIRGFVDANASYQKDKLSFGFGEQDLFITSSLNDRLSFLGETVFKYDHSAHTEFSISVERVIIKYNYKGNHNFILGKVHTPLNYWNDTYHHGRVFFPTIERPAMFNSNIIPLHSTGVGFQGYNLSDLKFGYDVFLSNGLASEEIADFDKNKAVTIATHIKPVDNLRIGASLYMDKMSKGSDVHGLPVNYDIQQNLLSGSVSYFGPKYEFLAEGTLGFNHTDTAATATSRASYVYAGLKVKEKIVPYLRYDFLYFQPNELYFTRNNLSSIVFGIRYQINYLAVVKLEYKNQKDQLTGTTNRLTTQFAIGF
ncbi:MAG: hypothetical protein JNM95_12715 [Chitinophagaceae bacterium]|nr:hypothetical protein [Chitinophagaceae bacterium]